MDDGCTANIKIILIDGINRVIPTPLVDKLTLFMQQHYQLPNKEAFINAYLQPKQPGELALFFNTTNTMIGYTRVKQHEITQHHKTITVYCGHSFCNPYYNLNLDSARFCLTQSMKYKLMFPKRTLVYFSCVVTPEKYRFLATLNPNILPRPNVSIPTKVLHLANQLKSLYNWNTSSNNHPMVLPGLPSLKSKHACPSDSSDDPFIRFFSTVVPSGEGHGLLTYIPLDATHIGYAIKQLVAQQRPSLIGTV